MKNYNILVPIDFSDLSLKAFESANSLAEIMEGTVTPYHCYIPLTDVDNMNLFGTDHARREDEVRESLLKRLNESAAEFVNAHHLKTGIIDVGKPSTGIIERGADYDLIVMTTNGRTGFSRLLMGSVAERVLRTSATPVLVVEEYSNLTPLENILVTTDLSDNSQAVMPYAREIAEKAGASVDVVHIVSTENYGEYEGASAAADERKPKIQEMIDEFFSGMGDRVKGEVLVSSKSPHEALFDLDFSRSYNLICMSTVGKTGLKYLMLGSTTSNVARNVETAVLCYNPKAKHEDVRDKKQEAL